MSSTGLPSGYVVPALGSPLEFRETIERDYSICGTPPQFASFQSINRMAEYNLVSFEELRLLDYQLSRKPQESRWKGTSCAGEVFPAGSFFSPFSKNSNEICTNSTSFGNSNSNFTSQQGSSAVKASDSTHKKSIDGRTLKMMNVKGIARPDIATVVLAINFAVGTTAADVKKAMVTSTGTTCITCDIISTGPKVVAKLVYPTKTAAESIAAVWNGARVDGHSLQVWVTDDHVKSCAPAASPLNSSTPNLALPSASGSDVDSGKKRSPPGYETLPAKETTTTPGVTSEHSSSMTKESGSGALVVNTGAEPKSIVSASGQAISNPAAIDASASIFAAKPQASSNNAASESVTPLASTKASSLFGKGSTQAAVTANSGSAGFRGNIHASSTGSLFGRPSRTYTSSGEISEMKSNTKSSASLLSFGSAIPNASGGSASVQSNTKSSASLFSFGPAKTNASGGSVDVKRDSHPSATSVLFGPGKTNANSGLFGGKSGMQPSTTSALFGPVRTNANSGLFGNTQPPATGGLFGKDKA